MPFSPDPDRTAGLLLGLALGDALGMPVDGLSHQNVRTYYKGIKELRADEKRGGLGAGQWTAHTQRARALARALARPEAAWPEALGQDLGATDWRRGQAHTSEPSAAGAACAAPLGLAWAARGWTDARALGALVPLLGFAFGNADARAAAFGQAAAVRIALTDGAPGLDGSGALLRLAHTVREAERALDASGAVSARLVALAPHLDAFPLDLQDLCNGTGSRADEAFPFALAMVARGPDLPEATLLSAVNVGGAASAVGAICGALLGALHGASAFPPAWTEGLEDAPILRREAFALTDALAPSPAP